jgi:hypothetical protein
MLDRGLLKLLPNVLLAHLICLLETFESRSSKSGKKISVESGNYTLALNLSISFDGILLRSSQINFLRSAPI